MYLQGVQTLLGSDSSGRSFFVVRALPFGT